MRERRRTASFVVAAWLFGAGLLAHPAWSFPELNLTPATPRIVATSVETDYSGDNANGTLRAQGNATRFFPLGSSSFLDITNGIFDLFATVQFNTQFAVANLTISGMVASLGFNSGDLLTGEFLSTSGNGAIGAGAGDPLEFLFTVTGGEAAGLFGGLGATAGVILSNSGYSGSFASDLSGFSGLAETFAIQTQASLPEPTTLTLILLGLAAFVWARERSVPRDSASSG